TPAYQLLFAEPDSTQPVIQTGTYQLEISSLFFEENSDLNPQLVLLGQVYGLAGTDFWRRDLVVPLFWGMPFVLFVGLLGTFITTLVAIILPAIGVWYGGWLDDLIQRLTEVNMVLPGLAIVVLTNLLFGVNVWIVLGIIVVLNAFGSPIKSFRSAFLQAKEAPYIEMARSYGASDFRIITRYLVPRILPVFIPQLVTQVPSFIFLEATLGFFNINSHYPSWGRIIYDGLAHGAIYGSPFWVLEPIFLLLLTGLAFAMLGSALERILNPRIISDVPLAGDKEKSNERKSWGSKLNRRLIAAAIVSLLVIAIFVPTIQGKSLASFVIHFMDETRNLHTTNLKPPVIPTRTSLPAASTPTDMPASATEPVTTPTIPVTFTPTTQASCIPANRPATAKVLEVIDGNTIKVLMDGLVYVVRYIGVELPQDDGAAMDAYLVNSELVFRKEVTLIGDRMYKDPSGRLLRYVLVGDTFVNLWLLENGWGEAVDLPPNSSCTRALKSAQELAMQSAVGIWAVPTPSP
ncbi:MAG TPA: ABC transporter permease subunit, partial [Anaerolineales bacterium]|nr:ABC transporter permease subunit [Anaerolineales bacterium]